MLRDGDEKLLVREDRQLLMLLVSPDTIATIIQPVRHGKVDSLIHVELQNRVRNWNTRQGTMIPTP